MAGILRNQRNKDGSVALFENEWDNNNFTQNNPFIFFDKKPNPNAAYYKSAIKGNPTEKDNVGERPGVKLGSLL